MKTILLETWHFFSLQNHRTCTTLSYVVRFRSLKQVSDNQNLGCARQPWWWRPGGKPAEIPVRKVRNRYGDASRNVVFGIKACRWGGGGGGAGVFHMGWFRGGALPLPATACPCTTLCCVLELSLPEVDGPPESLCYNEATKQQ